MKNRLFNTRYNHSISNVSTQLATYGRKFLFSKEQNFFELMLYNVVKVFLMANISIIS